MARKQMVMVCLWCWCYKQFLLIFEDNKVMAIQQIKEVIKQEYIKCVQDPSTF